MSQEYTLSYTASDIDERLGKAGDAVLCTEQSLTDGQKIQARENIGALSNEIRENLAEALSGYWEQKGSWAGSTASPSTFYGHSTGRISMTTPHKFASGTFVEIADGYLLGYAKWDTQTGGFKGDSSSWITEKTELPTEYYLTFTIGRDGGGAIDVSKYNVLKIFNSKITDTKEIMSALYPETYEQKVQARENIGALSNQMHVNITDSLADYWMQKGNWAGGTGSPSEFYNINGADNTGRISMITPYKFEPNTLVEVSSGYQCLYTKWSAPTGGYSGESGWITEKTELPTDYYLTFTISNIGGGNISLDKYSKMKILQNQTVTTDEFAEAVFPNDEIQQARARANIGATSIEEVEEFLSTTNNAAVKNPALIGGTSIAEKCKQFAALNLSSDLADSFIFFTDPHSYPEEEDMRAQLHLLETYYNTTAAKTIICGGDWLRNSETPEVACYKLAYYYSWLDRISRGRNICVGANHDTNAHGLDADGNANMATAKIPYSTVKNLMARGEDHVYYSYDSGNTKFYALDTASESDSYVTDYYWEQIAWLGEKLKADDADNSALVYHAVYRSNGDGYVSTAFTDAVTQLCNAYNNATTITLNNVTYDFTDCTGCVRFVIGGHMHKDIVENHNNIPVISSIDMKADNDISFDLCMADYTNNKLHMIRIGSGEDRTVQLAQ